MILVIRGEFGGSKKVLETAVITTLLFFLPASLLLVGLPILIVNAGIIGANTGNVRHLIIIGASILSHCEKTMKRLNNKRGSVALPPSLGAPSMGENKK
jgi:hypothetical protein